MLGFLVGSLSGGLSPQARDMPITQKARPRVSGNVHTALASVSYLLGRAARYHRESAQEPFELMGVHGDLLLGGHR